MSSQAIAAASPGILTQSIKNLQQMLQQISNISPLPASAEAVEKTAQAELTTDISKIQAAQKSIIGYCDTATPAVKVALSHLAAGKDLSTISSDLKTTIMGVHTMQFGVTSMNKSVQKSKSVVIGLESQLAAINKHLTDQIIYLQTQLKSEEDSIAAKRKNYLYLLALGPFGLIGLAAAATAIGVQEGQIASKRSEMAKQQAVVARTKMLQVGISHLNSTMVSIVNNMSSVKNAVDFLAGDLNTIEQDLTAGSNAGALQIYLNTALQQINTLRQDAS